MIHVVPFHAGTLHLIDYFANYRKIVITWR